MIGDRPTRIAVKKPWIRHTAWQAIAVSIVAMVVNLVVANARDDATGFNLLLALAAVVLAVIGVVAALIGRAWINALGALVAVVVSSLAGLATLVAWGLSN